MSAQRIPMAGTVSVGPSSRRPMPGSVGAALVTALILAGTVGAQAGAPRGGDATPRSTLKEVGDVYETGRLLAGAERLAALTSVQQSVAQVLHGGLDADERAAARFLSGRVHHDLGEYAPAGEDFRAAADGDGPFADDAAFAAIEALEASGADAEAAREWLKWEKRFPQSRLLPGARLKQAWNALRRGDVTSARKQLAALSASHPWIRKEAQFVLADATTSYASGNPAEALVALGPQPSGASAVYLKALCLQAQGKLLKAAAAYQ